MSEQNKSDEKSPQLATSGITIAAFLLGLFFLQDTIFNPTRPGMINTEKGVTENIRSRLWQDPFEVVDEHISKNFSKKNHYENNFQKFIRHPLPLRPEHAIENSIQPIRICSRDNLDDEQELVHSIDELHCQVQLDSTTDIHVLAVMVPGGPYAEDGESRLRSRFALIMALLNQGYAPEDPDHIGFVHFANACKQYLNDFGSSIRGGLDNCQMPDTMPYEWFKAHTDDLNQSVIEHINKRILVLWLNNDAFNRSENPLYLLGLLNYLIAHNKTKQNVNFHVIGPANSDTLEKMYREVSKLNKNIRKVRYYKFLQNSYIYTASATISKKHLYDNQNWDKNYGETNHSWLDDTIVRTISTQDKIANSLLCELALRGVTPYHIGDNKDKFKENKYCQNINDLVLKESNQPDQIVLISEADTFYATMLTKSILDEVHKFDTQDPQKKKEELNSVLVFKYLRGLDGITSKSISLDQNKNKDQESKVKNPNEKETKALWERPVGNSQLDYLLGLGVNLKQIEKIKIEEGKGTFKAIGIIGSDTYDKLLILQALRNKFPGTPFFTTDVDARFMHPSEIKWTRNLIVVSPFGLQLNETTQKFSPPFRDNFQTSLYSSVLLALNCINGFSECKNSTKDSALFWTKHPRIFEIGNHGVVNLSHESNTFLDVQEPEEKQSSKKFPTPSQVEFFKILCSMAFLAYLLTFFTPKQFHIYIKIIALILLVPILIYTLMPDHLRTNSLTVEPLSLTEPLSFTNGISSWPATVIRLCAIILAFCFLIRTHKLLVASQKETQNEFILQDTASSKENQVNSNVEIKKRKLRYSLLKLWSKLTIDKWKINSTNFEKNWLKYIEKIKLRHSIIRVTGVFIIFYTFAFLVLHNILNTTAFIPYAPFRGESNFFWSHFFFLVTVWIYLILIIYIADNVHASSHFIRRLADNRPFVWSSELVKIYKKKYDLPLNIIESKILLDFVTQHTEVHNKFIYYPFFCLFLIIMSRNNYFDSWPTTPFILLIYIFFAMITLISAIRLRAAALYAKSKILENLKTNSSHSPICEWEDGQSDNIIKLKSLTTEIENFKEGIFRPLLHHPMILSLLMPFSSVSGIFLIEYLV